MGGTWLVWLGCVMYVFVWYEGRESRLLLVRNRKERYLERRLGLGEVV